MNRVINDFKGSWILFFHYMKWPIFLGLPILYFYLDYNSNIIMEIVWVYCAYLVGESLINLYKNRGKVKKCGGSCGTKF